MNKIATTKPDNELIIGSVNIEMVCITQYDITRGSKSIGQQVDEILMAPSNEGAIRKVTVHLDEERM